MSTLRFFLICFLPFAILHTFSVPHSIVLSLLCSVFFLWIVQPVPMALTALLIPVAATLLGILPATKAFAAFGSPIVFLLLGVLLLVVAIQQSKLDERCVHALFSRLRSDPSAEKVILTFTLLAWILGMWMSNTATCALLLPIALAVFKAVGSTMKSENDSHAFAARLFLTCAFTPSIGGMLTPIGSLPNMIALRTLSEAGYTLGFFDWMAKVAPVSIFMLFASYLLLRARFPLAHLPVISRDALLSAEPTENVPWSQAQRFAAFSVLLAALGWILPGALRRVFPDSAFFHTLDQLLTPTTVIYLALLPLFLAPGIAHAGPVLRSSHFAKVDWSTLLLFAGGLSLAQLLETSGVATWIASSISIFATHHILIVLVISAIISIVLSEFSSNTAAAAVLVPIALSLSKTVAPGNEIMFVFIVVLACGFGYMLPISTPPNAIVYATGKIRLRDMAISGVLLDCVGAVMLPLLCYFLLR